MKVLLFGDIVGKIGRRGVAALMPHLKRKYAPDLVIANAENLAHGKGVTSATLEEVKQAGVQFFTSGNHIWDKPEVNTLFADPNIPLLRPANYPKGLPGRGYALVPVADTHENTEPIKTRQNNIEQHQLWFPLGDFS